MSASATISTPFPGPLSPVKITAIYALVGVLWIPITDQLLLAWIGDESLLTLIQTLKGGMFVLATAMLLYLLIERSVRLLREEHTQLKAVIEGTPDAIFIKDIQGHYVLMNTAGARYLGKSVEEVLGWEAAALLPPDTAQELLEEDRQVLAGGQAKTFEHAFTIAEKKRIFSCTKAPYRDAKGRISGVIGMARDITERKRAEEALRESREGYRSLIDVIDTSPVGIFIVDPALRVRWANLTLEHYFGLRREEVIGQDKRRLVQEQLKGRFEDPEGFSERVLAAYANNTYVEHFECHVLAHETGQERWLEHRSQPIQTGLYAGGRLEQYYDITARKRAEQTIRLLLGISERLNAVLDPDQLLDTLIQQAIELTQAENGCSGLRTPEGMVCHTYFQRHEIHSLDYCWPPGHGLPGWVLTHKRPYLTNDAYNDPQIVPELRARFEVRSALSTPILDSHGEVIGFFEVHNKKEPSGFTLADQELMIAVSHLAAIALHNALAYETIRRAEAALKRANDELERRVQERTAELVRINDDLQAEIAERQQTEAALRESEERFRQLVEHLQEIFWMSTADGSQVLYVSPAYETIRGHSRERIYANPADWLEAIHPEDQSRLPDLHAEIVTTGKCEEEYRIIRPDGTVRWIWSRGFPVRDAAGRIYRIAGIVQDITERKTNEEKLRQQQAELAHLARFALAGEMASGLAHELNQPLGAIRTYAETCLLLIHAGQLDREALTETLEQVTAQAQRAGEIIRRLRNLVRKVEPQRSLVNINALIQDIMPLIEPEARQQAVQIRLELDEALPSLFADGIQIQQVFLNLARNAIEAMSESQVEPRILTIRTVPAGSESLEVAVSDTGPGVSAETRERLFMPFFTTKPTGMGLGLPLSKSIIEAHGGNLWATANPDRGVTFHFTLPYEPRKRPR